MKDEIKEIEEELAKISFSNIGHYVNTNLILDYITNLQEKSNNQAEEINRLYKQREKFMKKYGYLKEENESLKELCDKYEEEHSTTFNEWKETITDKYQTLKNLQEEKDKYKNVIDKIKEKLNVLNEEPYNATTYIMVITEIYKLLEEVE